jgi:hypothetical protein
MLLGTLNKTNEHFVNRVSLRADIRIHIYIIGGTTTQPRHQV